MTGIDGAKQDPSTRSDGALYDAAELEQDADLDLDRKRAILETFYRLDRLNHYQLLGLENTAEKRLIRSKYQQAVTIFHPDRYYGKKLGGFKAKLERIFQQLTEAHDVLTRSEARAEYDAYIEAEQRTQEFDRELSDREAFARELQAVQARIEAEARTEVASRTPAPPVPPEPRPESVANQAPEPSPTNSKGPDGSNAPGGSHASDRVPRESARVFATHTDPEVRRRALARKLGLSSPPPGPRASVPPPGSDPSGLGIRRAAEELKRRYELKMLEAKRRQASEYEVRAESAERSGDWVAAVNALRVAASLDPDRPEIRSRLSRIEYDAADQLAYRYLEQAGYEERERRFSDAARSYARALAKRPTPQTHERLAHALLMSQGDSRSALDHAREAVLLSPNEAKFRVTLARAYLAAKLRESAIGEMERAAALAPADQGIREQLKALKRGDS